MQETPEAQLTRKVGQKDIKTGEASPWDIFSSGSLLLAKGSLIKDEGQIRKLISSGARYFISAQETDAVEQLRQQQIASTETAVSFLILDTLLQRLEAAFALIQDEKDRTFINRIMRIALEIQYACDENTDAMIGSIQLLNYPAKQLELPLHNAILCEAVCRRMGKGPLDRLPIVVAALTRDIGMMEIQQEVFHQEEPLSKEQKAIIDSHPARSKELLEAKGVTDKRWLTAVYQHHERLDGSGYPNGIRGNQLSEDAKLLAITDNYTALISPRAYRSRILHKEVLREILQQRGKAIDADLTTLLINAIGIYSPGSLVRMESGEIGLITRQSGKRLDTPYVRLITNGAGQRCDIGDEFPTGEEHGQIKSMLCHRDHQDILQDLGTIWPMQHPLARDAM